MTAPPLPHRLAVLAAAILCFSATVSFDFVYDDFWVVVGNRFLGRPSAWVSLLDGRALGWGVPDAARPLAVLSAALDHAVFGAWAGGHHATSILLHAGVVALVLRLASALGLGARASIAAGAFFALAPVHAEAVAVVSYREDLLATLLVLAALDAALRDRPLLAATLALFAPLAKESAITAPALAVVVGIIARPVPRRGLAALCAGTGLWLAWRLATVGLSAYGPAVAARPSLALHAPQTIAEAFGRSLVPLGFSPAHAPPQGSTGAILGALALAALLAVAAVVRRRVPLATLGLTFFVVAMLPTANLLAMPVPRAERFAYLPSVGTALAIGAIAAQLDRLLAPRVLALGGLSACAALWVTSAIACRPYRSDDTLWRAAAAASPTSARAQAGLARTLRMAGDPTGAASALARALALDPRDPAAQVVAAVQAYEHKRYEESLRALDRAAELGVVPAWQVPRNRAVVLLASGKRELAERELAACQRRHPFIDCREGIR